MTTQAVVQLSVTGMTCGSCVRHVSDALRSVPGVAQATVDLEAGRAVVSYDPANATSDQLLKAVTGAGYGAEVAIGEDVAPRARSQHCGCCGTR